MDALLTIPLLLALTTAPAQVVTLRGLEVAPGVHVFSTSPDGYVPNGNALVSIGPDDVLVFDTFTRPSTARSLVEAIRTLTKKPVRWIINSHWHPDHWFGNDTLLQAFPGAVLVTSEETRQLMLATMKTWKPRFEAELRSADGKPLSADDVLRRDFLAEGLMVRFQVPAVTFGDTLILRQGEREVHLMSMVGDARGTVVLWIPQDRLVATGDVVSGPVPYFTPPLGLHARSLRTVLALDPATVVPGHGPVRHDVAQVRLQLDLYESILRQARVAMEQGEVSIEDVQKRVDVASFRHRFTGGKPELDAQFDRYVLRMVENVYRELRDGKSFTR